MSVHSVFPTLPTPVRESVEFGGRTFSIEMGKYAKQAGGAAWVCYGDARVLVTVVGGGVREGTDFFPLTVDYIEKTYAVGKFPGGFIKREGRLSNHEVLTSRLIDRPLRPLFPEGYTNEVQIIATVHSADNEVPPEVMALVGASAATLCSDLPWDGPVAGVRIGKVGGKLVANPTPADLARSTINLLVAARREAIVMVEGEADEVSEAEMIEALLFAHEAMQPVLDMQLRLREKIGKAKAAFSPPKHDETRAARMREAVGARLAAAFEIHDKLDRYAERKKIVSDFIAGLDSAEAAHAKEYKEIFHDLEYHAMRNALVEQGKRVDGRTPEQVRPIWIETGIFPRAHGSAVFTRGETQVMASVTLGTKGDAQIVENITGETHQKFMLHYNFPPYSVGEVKRLGTPGRREVGHGVLAERALRWAVPVTDSDDQAAFPYTVRVVSEVTESNGSSSMGTICSGCLALMDAGVPMRKPVAGIAMGLVEQGGKTVILSDILGDEDHLGDMDFKVAGTAQGITALQMDIKVSGLSRDILTRALEQARVGRLHILDQMAKAMTHSRPDISTFAPRITRIQIPVDKIRDVIGSGGKTIRHITSTTGVSIDVGDDGTVLVSSPNEKQSNEAVEIIRRLTAVPEVGRIYRGIVKRIAEFGAFIEILPNQDGLCHISQLDTKRVAKTSDVVKEGDEVEVQVIGLEPGGKIRLSRRSVIEMREEAGNK